MSDVPVRRWLLAAAVAAWAGQAMAQPGIYTCVDGRGNRITSDRPIIECIDRSQKDLNPSGTVRRNVGPSLTAQERAAQEERDRRAAEDQARIQEERRRNRAILMRYRNQETHDSERLAALNLVDEVIAAAQKRVGELDKERVGIANELEFYQGTPDKVPGKLRRMAEENSANMAAQKRFIADQEAEKQRINMRFDEELARLRQLWSQAQPGRP
jgi:hypothetical protein